MSVLRVLLAGLLLVSGAALSAQDAVKKPGIADPAKLEGKVLNKASPDDVRVLGILAFSLMNEAQARGKPVPLAQLALSAQAVKAYNAKDHETAYRLATRFILLRRGMELNEETEVASSLDFHLDRRIAGPKEVLTASLVPLFDLGKPLSAIYTAKVNVQNAEGKDMLLLPPVPIHRLKNEPIELSLKGLKDGRYTATYELFSPSGKSLVKCDRPFLIHATARPRVEKLTRSLDMIRSLGDSAAPRLQSALESLECVVEFAQRTLKEYVTSHGLVSHPMVIRLRGSGPTRAPGDQFDIEKDLVLAEKLAAGLLKGTNGLNTMTGDLHLGYRSAVDNSMQPFRLLVPKNYDPAKKYPLIVALHGATGDENTYMDRYLVPGTQDSLFKKLGEERGYILVSPNGRGPFGGYTGDSEKDVLDVLDRVLQSWSVDPKQVFLTGHSMGAVGTWLIGFRHPERFAALAPLAGRPQDLKSMSLAKAAHLPVMMFHGSKDTIATVQAARELVKVAEKALKHFKYVEHPDDDHFIIGVTSMPKIFDFFDAQRKK